MLLTGMINCALGLVFACAALVCAKKNPTLIANGFLLELALLFFVNGISYIVWNPNDQSSVTLLVFTIIIYGLWALYAVLGVCLLINGVLTVRREGTSLTHLLPFVWGALLVFVSYWMFFGPENNFMGYELTGQLIALFTMFVAYIPFALFGVWLSNEICYRAPAPPEENYIVVLGCGLCADGSPTPLLQGRLDAALAAYKRGCESAHIIVSGGQGADEVISEAASMARYLREHGVPESHIICEDESHTTQENLRNSRALMRARNEHESDDLTCSEARTDGEHAQSECSESTHSSASARCPTTCTIATSNYHCLRAAMYARKLGMRVRCVGGRTAAFYFPAAFFREYIALIMHNRYAIALFFVLTIARFALSAFNILPSGII